MKSYKLLIIGLVCLAELGIILLCPNLTFARKVRNGQYNAHELAIREKLIFIHKHGLLPAEELVQLEIIPSTSADDELNKLLSGIVINPSKFIFFGEGEWKVGKGMEEYFVTVKYELPRIDNPQVGKKPSKPPYYSAIQALNSRHPKFTL